jgi:hypothetical protein
MSIQRRATIIWRRLSGVGGGAKSASRSHVRVERRWSLVKRFSCRSGEKKTVTGGVWEGDQRRAARDTNRRHRGGWEGGRKKERERAEEEEKEGEEAAAEKDRKGVGEDAVKPRVGCCEGDNWERRGEEREGGKWTEELSWR